MKKTILLILVVISLAADSMIFPGLLDVSAEKRRAVIEELVNVGDDYFRERRFEEE